MAQIITVCTSDWTRTHSISKSDWSLSGNQTDERRAGAQINFPESGRGLGHVTPTIFGSTVGYPSDSLASCITLNQNQTSF